MVVPFAARNVFESGPLARCSSDGGMMESSEPLSTSHFTLLFESQTWSKLQLCPETAFTPAARVRRFPEILFFPYAGWTSCSLGNKSAPRLWIFREGSTDHFWWRHEEVCCLTKCLGEKVGRKMTSCCSVGVISTGSCYLMRLKTYFPCCMFPMGQIISVAQFLPPKRFFPCVGVISACISAINMSYRFHLIFLDSIIYYHLHTLI